MSKAPAMIIARAMASLKVLEAELIVVVVIWRIIDFLGNGLR